VFYKTVKLGSGKDSLFLGMKLPQPARLAFFSACSQNWQ